MKTIRLTIWLAAVTLSTGTLLAQGGPNCRAGNAGQPASGNGRAARTEACQKATGGTCAKAGWGRGQSACQGNGQGACKGNGQGAGQGNGKRRGPKDGSGPCGGGSNCPAGK